MSRHTNRAIESQVRQIDEIFRTHSNTEQPHVVTIVDIKKDKLCDFHGKSSSPASRRESSVNLSRKSSNASTFCSTDKLNAAAAKKNSRNSISSFTELIDRNLIPDENGNGRNAMRRESMPIIDSNGRRNNPLDTWNSRLFKGMEHPSKFPNMLRSTTSINGNNVPDMSRRASSNWNVNHFHNYSKENGSKHTNLDRKQSASVSEKIFKRDYTQSPEPKKELHSILKHKKSTADDDELKEIIKRLSFDYIESEMARNGHKMDVDLLSNSDSSSGGGNGRNFTTNKSTPRRISIDSLESSSRRSSRRFSDFSVNSDDLTSLKTRANNKTSVQVSLLIEQTNKLRI
ncbi:hypothetical protein PVAND_008606 [Polypedilum vanderplanki]|uniref:Uncharacterized protein n=1 Tax=Polypedilum vanderplanki TaxID=319348 RepID=A0A9J6CAR5_POLVA|nr:hypothetical protein PVAND_008606 [Polypedilum vanderplanki]